MATQTRPHVAGPDASVPPRQLSHIVAYAAEAHGARAARPPQPSAAARACQPTADVLSRRSQAHASWALASNERPHCAARCATAVAALWRRCLGQHTVAAQGSCRMAALRTSPSLSICTCRDRTCFKPQWSPIRHHAAQACPFSRNVLAQCAQACRTLVVSSKRDMLNGSACDEGKLAASCQLRCATPLPHHRAHPNSLRLLGHAGNVYAVRRGSLMQESL